MIRALIVDDEPLAREGIRLRLDRESDFDVVGEAEDGGAAVAAITTLTPDVVFLDVQMPGLSGFDVLERVGGAHLPVVVFVTAHDQHALKAFEVHALDYLLKPYTEARFQAALTRVRAELADAEDFPGRARLGRLLDARDAAPGYLHRFTVRDRDRIVFVRAEEVEAIAAAGNYIELVTASGTHLMRMTLSEAEAKLDPAMFARIHRSTIVNKSRIREIRPDPHGDAEVVMASGASYRLSRAYKKSSLTGS
jgi:two-component system LytT family response regulator